MQKSLIAVVAAGLFIGFMWPQGEAPAPAKAAAAAGGEAKEVLLEKASDGHFYADVLINGEPLRMMVDTGASMVAIGPEHARRLGIEFDPSEFVPIARTASGIANGKDVTFRTVSIDGKKVSEVSGAIVEGLEMPLLGQAYLGRLAGIEMAGDYMRIE